MSNIWIAILLSALLHSPVLAGVVLEIDVKDREQSTTEQSTMQIEGKQLKMNIVADNRSTPDADAMVYRGEQREMVIIDARNKSYMVVDRQSIQAVAGTYNKAMSQMEQMMKSLPPEQRAMIERMQQQHTQPHLAAPDSELRKTGVKAEQAGYPCEQYEIWRAGRKEYELWVTDWKKVEGGEEAKEALQEMAVFFRDMRQSFRDASGASGPPGGKQFDNGFFAHLDQLNGFPVVTKEWQGDIVKRESTLRTARRQTIPASAFEPPSGFTERRMFGQR